MWVWFFLYIYSFQFSLPDFLGSKSTVCLLCVCECEMVTHVVAVQVEFVLDYRCLHGIFAKIFGAHLHLYTFSEFTGFESIRMLIIIC